MDFQMLLSEVFSSEDSIVPSTSYQTLSMLYRWFLFSGIFTSGLLT